MPSGGSSDKAKGAILSRAVTYIRQLKENEGRNIEKWTLEKLLMDQAMAELQTQNDDLRQQLAEARENLRHTEQVIEELRVQIAGGDSTNKRPRSND
jgi:bHLH factor